MSEDAKGKKVREEATGPRSEDEKNQKMRGRGTGPRTSLGKNRGDSTKLRLIGNCQMVPPNRYIF